VRVVGIDASVRSISKHYAYVGTTQTFCIIDTRLLIATFARSPPSGCRSRYSDWLRPGRPRGRSSSPDRVKNFLFSTSSRPGSGVHPTSYPMGTGSSFQDVKRQGREADRSPPVSAEVKKMWIYTSTPHTPSWHSA
jgi:hypothetical protein